MRLPTRSSRRYQAGDRWQPLAAIGCHWQPQAAKAKALKTCRELYRDIQRCLCPGELYPKKEHQAM